MHLYKLVTGCLPATAFTFSNWIRRSNSAGRQTAQHSLNPLIREHTRSSSRKVTVAAPLHLVQKEALLSDSFLWYCFQLDAAMHNKLDPLKPAASNSFNEHNPIFTTVLNTL